MPALPRGVGGCPGSLYPGCPFTVNRPLYPLKSPTVSRWTVTTVTTVTTRGACPLYPLLLLLDCLNVRGGERVT